MKKTLELDLTDLGDIMEGLVKKLDQNKLSQPEMIDIAARLKPVAKHCETFDKAVKAMVKNKLNNKEGSMLGTLFKAVLKIIPTSRFSQADFKAEKPAMYEKFMKENDEERITFELR